MSESETPVLQFEQVNKSYGKVPVLSGVDLTANAGDLTVVYGPPASGKSVLVRILTGLERAVMLQYPNVNLRVRRRTAGACDAESFVFRVRGAALGECKPRATRSTACPAGQPARGERSRQRPPVP